MAALRTPLYREFLTPTLHRRFTGAALVILILSYTEAVLIGEKTSFLWSWFPIGPAGIRTLLLFISALSIFVLRVAQLHVGSRSTISPSETFVKYLFRLETAQTLAWYLFSAWWFSEVYMWSAPLSADLGWISEGKAWERKKLNERPLYLRSVFFMLAIIQSWIHLYYDYDKVTLPVAQPKTESTAEQSTKNQSPTLQLKDLVPSLSRSINLRAGCISLLGPILYALFIRSTAWNCSLYFAELLWDVPKSRLSYIPPYHYSLIIRSYTSGTLLLTLWEISNAIFSTNVAQEPLKRDQPLTSESKDPNGTLLIGLRTKREVPRTFAFWELSYISQRFEARRKAIFADIDRKDGSAWQQIMTVSLNDNILGISKRISEYQTPASASVPPQQPVTIETLPRITSTNIQQSNIFRDPQSPTTRRGQIESSIGTIAKHYGQSPEDKHLGSALQKLSMQAPQQMGGLLAQYNEYLMRFLRTPAGYPFRRTFKRRVCAVLLGTPYSESKPIVDSISSLTALALASLTEDRYGNVAKDVPLLIRVFVTTISSIEAFVTGLQPHWTDVEFSEADREVQEVNLVVVSLKCGLRDMVGAFAKYAVELGLEPGEIRLARTIAGVEGDA